MNGLENFPIAPSPGYVTIHELHGEFKSYMDAEGGAQPMREVCYRVDLL